MTGALIAARAIQFASTISLAGAFAFEVLVARWAVAPVRGEGSGAVGRDRGFARLAWGSLLLVVLSGAGWLVLEASQMSGRPVGAALIRHVVPVVLEQTRFGRVWLLRLGCVVLLGGCLLARQHLSAAAGPIFDCLGLALGAVLLASLAWAGHGAASSGASGDLHLAADILHLLAAGLWLGMLLPLGLWLGQAGHIGGDAGARLARTATLRFSTLAIASVAVLFATGVVNTWFLAGSVPALMGTRYGRLLLLKIAIFAAMLGIAAVNRWRLSPRLAASSILTALRAIGALRRNTTVELLGGLGILALVGVLGALPPGLHTEPRWPLPFRLDFPAPLLPADPGLALVAALCGGCAIAAAAFAAAGRYRRAVLSLIGTAAALALGWAALRPVVEPAYPTSFYAPAEPYAAFSVARGAALYAANCAFCHGAGGKGDGPEAVRLPIRPADLTAPHVLAHAPGDLYWWISHGRSHVMPGFATALSPNRRWDVINFVRARAAAALARAAGSTISTAAALPFPDFAFETQDHGQETLSSLLKTGPVLLVLFRPPTPAARLVLLATETRPLANQGLSVIAIDLAGPRAVRPPVISVSAEARASLALFAADDREVELLLDRAGMVRARWAGGTRSGLPDPRTLAAEARRIARSSAAPPSHAGHAQ